MVALYPRTDELPGIEDTGIDEFLVRFRRETTWLMWIGVLAGTAVFHLMPLLTVYVPLPAFLLPRSLRDKHAQKIVGSPFYLVRQAVFLVRLSAGLCWGRDPKVRARFAMQPYPADPGTYRTT